MKNKKLRLNAEIRKGISQQFRNHLDNENTQEREAFLQSREQYPNAEKNAFGVIQSVVHKRFPKEDIDMQRYLDEKHELSNVRKDNCFWVRWKAPVEESRYNSHTKQQETIIVEKEQTKQFHFDLTSSVEGFSDHSDAMPFAYAMFREDLREQNLNPDIVAQWKGKEDSPHRKMAVNDCNRFLREEKFPCETCDDEKMSIIEKYENNFQLDVLGEKYCSSRYFDISIDELNILNTWQQAKQIVCQKHYEYTKSIDDQMKTINLALKSYTHFDQAKELAFTVGLDLEAIDKVQSSALTLYDPQSVADSLKSMKNKKISREDKIKARLLYEKESASQSLN